MVNYKYLTISIIAFLLLGCSKMTIKQDEPMPVKNIFLKSARIYTADNKGSKKAERVYNSSFTTSSVNYLWYELIVTNESSDQESGKVKLKEEWYGAGKRLLSARTRELNLPRGQKFLEFSAGYRGKEGWQKGKYKLKIYTDEKLLCEKQIALL